MHLPRRLAVPPLLLLALAGPCSIQAANMPSLSAIVLRSHDLPRGYRQISSRAYTVAQAAHLDHVSVSTFVRHGRLQSYKTSFRGKYLSGLYKVVDLVAAFSSGAGARWDYHRVVAAARQGAARHRHYREVRIARVGQASTAFSFDGVIRRQPVTVDVIRFYDRRYRVTVEVTGVRRSVKPANLLSYAVYLAQIVDRRIRRVG